MTDAAVHVHGRHCDRSGCERIGTWMPTLLVKPDLPAYEGPPVLVQMDLRVCDEHRADTTVGSLLSPTARLQISEAFGSLGRHPNIGSVELTFEAVT